MNERIILKHLLSSIFLDFYIKELKNIYCTKYGTHNFIISEKDLDFLIKDINNNIYKEFDISEIKEYLLDNYKINPSTGEVISKWKN